MTRNPLHAALVAIATIARSAIAEDSAALHQDLSGTDGRRYQLGEMISAAQVTVVIFFSAHCSCQRAHDTRLRALYTRYRTKRVQFVMVDSEEGASVETDALEVRARAYPFPILIDKDGRVAKSFSVQYATFTLVIDQKKNVRYRGAIDSDRTHLHPNAQMYLRDAIEATIADVAPAKTETEALGCMLRGW